MTKSKTRRVKCQKLHGSLSHKQHFLNPQPLNESYSEPMSDASDGPVSSLLSNGYQAAASFSSYLIGGLSSALASVAGPQASPLAIANTAKGVLALISLVLVQSIVTFVVTFGAVLLVLYASTQVFGLRFPFDFFLYEESRGGRGVGGSAARGDPRPGARASGGGPSGPRRGRQERRGKADVIDVYFDPPPL